MIARSGALAGAARVLDLKDHERAVAGERVNGSEEDGSWAPVSPVPDAVGGEAARHYDEPAPNVATRQVAAGEKGFR